VSQQASSGPSTELIAIVMFFAGFALGVQAERTNIPASPAAVAQGGSAAAQIAAAPASATPHAMRGMTGLLQLGGAIAP
jgi:hypothetical protein